MKTDNLFETLKEWVAAANPGFVTKDDLVRLEGRVDEILEIVDSLEEQLGVAPAKSDGRRPRPRP